MKTKGMKSVIRTVLVALLTLLLSAALATSHTGASSTALACERHFPGAVQ